MKDDGLDAIATVWEAVGLEAVLAHCPKPDSLLGAKLAGTGLAGQAEPALSALHGLSAAAVKTQGRRPPRDAEAQTGVMGEDVA